MMFDWRFFRLEIPNLIIFSFPPGTWKMDSFHVNIKFKFFEFPERKLVVSLLFNVNEFKHRSKNGLKIQFYIRVHF